MKIGLALRELHRSEDQLARKLLHASDRHKVDHKIYSVARDLTRWSLEHVRLLARAAERYDTQLEPEPRGQSRVVERLQEKVSETVGREPQASLLLLVDLREVYVLACGVSIDWELVAQAAQGVKDQELVALSKRCHPDTLRQVRWANGKLKESATQILVS